MDLINEFVKKLLNWQFCKIAMFTSLANILKLNDDAQHPEKLQKEFQLHLFKICRHDVSLARNLFQLSVEKVKEKLQSHMIDTINESGFLAWRLQISG